MRDQWLPTCPERTDWRPWIERYLNDPAQVSESELLTELCVPLVGAVAKV